jgi:phosphatidylserine/phosphatidylglycerophosphate/cardiolipin synthase-like enzyme
MNHQQSNKTININKFVITEKTRHKLAEMELQATSGGDGMTAWVGRGCAPSSSLHWLPTAFQAHRSLPAAPLRWSCLLVVVALSISDGTARASAQDIQDAITRAVKQSDPKGNYKGVTWTDWRYDTEFPSDWLLQTPGESVWGINSIPGWMSPGEPAECSGKKCNETLHLPTCDPSRPDACEAYGTTCVAAQATVLKPGDAPDYVCMSPADRMVDETYKAVASATSTIDITSLLPMDGRFMDGFQNALAYLAATGRKVTVRFLYGTVPFQFRSADNTLKKLVDKARYVQGSNLTVYVGRIRTGSLGVTGWNHSKTIIVDGTTLITGGQNWFAEDYLGGNPVFDLSVKVKGNVAHDATGFVNRVWKDLCDYENSPRRDSERYKATKSKLGEVEITDDCLSAMDVQTHPGNGSVRVMAVGRLGEIDYEGGDQSAAALLAMISAAQENIRISQQDIEGLVDYLNLHKGHRWPDDFLDVLAKQLIKQRTIHIVQSSDDGGGSLSGYSIGTLVDLAKKFKDVVKKQNDAPKKDSDVNDLLCKYLYLAQVRFTPGVKRLPGEKLGIRNHAKVIAVDDSTFYVGSQNIYPPKRNMEFGIIISDKDQFADFKSHYWDKLWENSKQSAISGKGIDRCYYKQ